MVVGAGEAVELFAGEAVEVGGPGQVSSEAADGVFDAAFLPGAVGIAEEGLDTKLLVELVVPGELGAVVEGDGSSQVLGKSLEQATERAGGDGCLAAGGAGQ